MGLGTHNDVQRYILLVGGLVVFAMFRNKNLLTQICHQISGN